MIARRHKGLATRARQAHARRWEQRYAPPCCVLTEA
jgi:hypothetical protein